MKRLSLERREYLARVNRKRGDRRLVSNIKKAIAGGAKPRLRTHAARKAKRSPLPLRVMAPEIFVLEPGDRRRELMQMLHTIRKRAALERKPVLVDFTRTKRMYPCGTLLFMAEIDRLRQITGGQKLVRGNIPQGTPG